MPNTHRRRRRDATKQFRLVGVGGVYWALVRPMSTVEHTRYARVFHCRQWSNYNIVTVLRLISQLLMHSIVVVGDGGSSSNSNVCFSYGEELPIVLR